MTDAKILIVEDDEPSAAHLEECLKNLGYTVCASVSCGHEAIEKAEHKHPDLALVNIGLKGKVTGLETAERIGSKFDVPVVYLTDEAEEDLLQRAQTTNLFGYIVKPFEERQLHLNIQTAISMHERESRHRKTEMRLKRIIRKLKNFTRLMKTVFDSMSEGVIAVDENRELVFHNSVARGFGEGLPVERDIDKWAENYGLFRPDGKTLVPKDESPLTLALNGKATDDFEVMMHNEEMPEGVHAHISISGRPLRGKAGALEGGVLVLRDITKLQHTEVELERMIAEQKAQTLLMETILSSISDGVLVANDEGEFTFFNPSAEQITGGLLDLKSEQWTGNYGVFYSNQKTRMPTTQFPLMRAVRGEETDDVEMFIRTEKRPDGYHISVSGRPLRTNVEGHGGGVIVFRDITERMLADEALEQAFAQGRLEVVDTILHNIGNAINSVTTGIETVRRSLVNDHVGRRLFALAAAIRKHQDDWSDYIKNDPQGRKVMPFILGLSESFSQQNEDLIKTVGRVRDRAHHIADIVRTQKSFGSSAMVRKNIVLHDALSAVLKVLRDPLNTKKIHTDIDCEDAPREIRIQESQFHQMLVNLVKNSIEAIDDLALAQGLDETPRIQLRASAEDDFLNLEVSDNGIGIRNKDTKVIFAPGYTTKKLGSGLGLHSAANFVIASGGRIQALSKGIGKGATMHIRLPLSAVAPQAMAG